MSSASVVGVRKAIATSFVIWSPAIGMTAVWRIAPPVKIATSVVPPPMSTKHTPKSLSSSDSTALLDASGCRIISRTSSPQRCTHFMMFCAAATAPVTICTSTSRRIPLIPNGFLIFPCPSMLNSCSKMCSICWSPGRLSELAVSTARSMSACATSRSLILTMPLALELFIWLPAIPV